MRHALPAEQPGARQQRPEAEDEIGPSPVQRAPTTRRGNFRQRPPGRNTSGRCSLPAGRPVNLPTQEGIHWTEPQVPIRATPPRAAPSTARPLMPGRKYPTSGPRPGGGRLLPLRRFWDERPQEECQYGGNDARGKIRRHPRRRIEPGLLHRRGQHAGQNVAAVARRPDQPGQDRPGPFRPSLHHQRHAQRPLAAHPEGRQEPQRRQVPRREARPRRPVKTA